MTLLTPADAGIELDVEETGETFEENARLKARAFCAASGLPSLADDSGIEVDALDGRPGVRSARYGGDGLDDADRTQLLLDELAGVPEEQRTCRYRVVLVLARPDGSEDIVDGFLRGPRRVRARRKERLRLRPHLLRPALRQDDGPVGPR